MRKFKAHGKSVGSFLSLFAISLLQVLDWFLSLCGLILQRNKLVEDSISQLQEMLKKLNSTSDEDNQLFMVAYVRVLDK